MALNITIKTVPMAHIRSEQAEDWFINNDGSIEVLVGDLNGNWKSETALGIHGLIEALKCKEAGITDMEVTQFDIQFEQERANGKQTLRAEAGDDQRSPYRVPHQAATFVERSVCGALGVDWDTHEDGVIGLAPRLEPE